MIRLVTICLGVGLWLGGAATGLAQETIRLASGEWAPYQSEHLKHNGLASRIVTQAFAQEGVKVEYGYFPWARSYEFAKTGEWDGTFLWFDTPERRAFFHISEPVLDIEYVFFHLKRRDFDWREIGDLKALKIGATLEYSYGEAFKQAEAEGQLKVERVATDELNFKKLLKGRIHIFPNEIESGYAMLRKLFTPEQVALFTHHPLPVRADPHHVLFPKALERSELMLERFNRGLKKLQESGEIARYKAEMRRANAQLSDSR